MSDSYYQRLTQLDHSFLIYEGPNSPMHVGATQIFEAAPLRRPEGGLDIERIEEYVQSRLHAIPRYRQRLSRTPIEGHPIWIDDPRFNIRYHVRHTRLPRPGDERLLKRTVGRIYSQHLDRGKPLWEMWVIEGLAGRSRRDRLEDPPLHGRRHLGRGPARRVAHREADREFRSAARVAAATGSERRAARARRSRARGQGAPQRRVRDPRPRARRGSRARTARRRASARSAASWRAAAASSRRARRSISRSAPTGAWTGWRWTCST